MCVDVKVCMRDKFLSVSLASLFSIKKKKKLYISNKLINDRTTKLILFIFKPLVPN